MTLADYNDSNYRSSHDRRVLALMEGYIHRVEHIGYNTLIAAYYSACDRHDWWWCDYLRPLIRDAFEANQAHDITA